MTDIRIMLGYILMINLLQLSVLQRDGNSNAEVMELLSIV